MTRHADSGFATTEFVLGVAVLLLPMVILVSLVPRWSEASLAASTAADAGAQAAAIAVATGADRSQAEDRGRVAAQSVLATHGVVGAVDVSTDTVQAEATVTVPLPAFPILQAPDKDIGRRGGDVAGDFGGLRTSATSIRLVDPFRAPEATSIRLDPLHAPEAGP